jgi:uncharacterized iron-regulated membrane protein
MWWKRRPVGKLGLPPAPEAKRAAWGVLGVVAVVGMIYPLVGVTLVVALIADGIVQRLRRGLAPAN